MTHRHVSDIAFTDTVKAEQEARGSRAGYAKMAAKRDWTSTITDELAGFIAERDSFYLATSNAEGRPYIQHRGGPAGFLKVLDTHRLGFADFGGNKQFITLGNLADNPKAFIFLMDYANRRRIKMWGQAEVVEGDTKLLARLTEPGYEAAPERAIVFIVEAWDVNCPQHITPRFTEAEVTHGIAPTVEALRARIAALEAENAALRSAAG